MALGGLSMASDAVLTAQVQGQLYRHWWPWGEHCLFVYWGCAAVKGMFFTVPVWEEYVFHRFCLRSVVFFSLNTLARNVCLPPCDMHTPMHYIVKRPPPPQM